MLLLFWFLQVTNDVIQSYVQAILSPDPRIESLLVQVEFLDVTKLGPSFASFHQTIANNSFTNDFVQEEQLVLLDEKFHHKNMYEYVDSRQSTRKGILLDVELVDTNGVNFPS